MVDLRSDTVTAPDASMREAAADAAVGDDAYGEDPTVNDLESTAADRLGTEAALFCPSGTMANQAAARVHAAAGEEVLLDRESHIYRWELGGLAALSGLQTRPVDASRGCPTADQVAEGFVEADGHRAGTGLLVLENTHNARGGLALAPDRIAAAATAAADRGVPVHLDGARLYNAAVAHDVSVTAYTDHVDTVMVSLSKGLGAPVGSVLAGPADAVESARRVRKLLGGGMRQAGIVAGPALLALDNARDLAADHDRARSLADGLAAVDGLAVQPPETNIVLVDVGGLDVDAETFLAACADAGVEGVPFDEHLVRFCTHRDVDDRDVERAVDAVAGVAEDLSG
ncbi:MAG: low specificity L-threonine aldolase [Halobacteriaceae archaeon]